LYASVTITVKFNLNALVRDLWPTLYISNPRLLGFPFSQL